MQVDEARVVDQLLAADQAAEVGPVPVRLQEHELDVTTVLRPVRTDERVHVRSRAAHRARLLSLQRGEHVRRQRPHRDPEEGDVDHRPLAGAGALEQRRGHPERQRHRTVPVTHGAALSDRLVHLRGREHVRQPTPGPERRRVVPRVVRIGPPHPVAVPARVHQRRIPLGERLGVEPEALQRTGPEVGEEHVGRLEELVQDGEALLATQVERDRSLASARERDRHVDATAVDADALRHEPAVGIALRPLDADHVGAPVGEQRTRHRHEHPLRELDDAYAFECTFVHWKTS